jgi:hypothetical protein
VVATGPAGGSRNGIFDIGSVNLSSARRYIRLNYTPICRRRTPTPQPFAPSALPQVSTACPPDGQETDHATWPRHIS